MGTRETDLNYNGINVFGDLVSANINSVAQTLEGQGILPSGSSAFVPNVDVSRTGYTEQELSDDDVNVFRASLALHFRPFGDKKDEIIYNGKIGAGTTLYQGASRYSIKDFVMQQHKLEYNSDHLLLRTYLTAEDAGNTYDIRFAGVNVNRAWKSDRQWFGEYVGAYAQAFGGAFVGAGVPGGNVDAAHSFARAAADTGRLVPGTAEFNQALARIQADPDVTTGARFVGKNNIFHSDAIYSFKDQIEFADVIVGASSRIFELDSDGTVYTDPVDGIITIREYGLFTQLKKGFLEDRLNLTGALRYDKSQNFDGTFTPKVSATYKLDEEGKNIIRASFQTGFRNPATQDQYIGLDVGNTILIGSASDNPIRYNKRFTNINSAAGQLAVGGNEVNFNGLQGYNNSFTLSSVLAYGEAVAASVANGTPLTIAGAVNAGVLEQANVDFIKQEQVRSFELGYRSRLTDKITLDVSGYYNEYSDFISIVTTVAPLYGDVSSFNPTNVLTDVNTQLLLNAIGNDEFTPTSLYTNTDADVASFGANFGVQAKIFKGFDTEVKLYVCQARI